jgi:hypothetical protein
MKRFAKGEKTPVSIPPIVKPIEVEVALPVIPIQIGHVAVAIAVSPDRNVQSIICATIL